MLPTGQLFTLGNPEDIPAEDFVTDQDVVNNNLDLLKSSSILNIGQSCLFFVLNKHCEK